MTTAQISHEEIRPPQPPGPLKWLKDNMFNSIGNTLVTVDLAAGDFLRHRQRTDLGFHRSRLDGCRFIPHALRSRAVPSRSDLAGRIQLILHLISFGR